MDNQQETLKAYIAGLMDGEGSFYLYRLPYKKRFQYRAYVVFTNCDPTLIKKVIDFCRYNQINYHVNTDIRQKGHKICYNFAVTSQDSRIRFIDLILPYMNGEKVEHARLVRDFLILRKLYRPTRTKQDHPDTITIYEQYKKLKGSSETTRKAPVIFLKQDEDIVRQPTKVD